MKVSDLRETSGKLNITGAGKLRKDELLKAILECPENEIKKALGMGLWNKYKKPLSYFGAIASIIALIFTFWFHQSSQKDNEVLKMKFSDLEKVIIRKPEDPAAVQKSKKDYEKKLAETEETIKNLKGVDIKVRDEALKAFKEGDYSKAKKLFADLDNKAKKRQEEVNRERAKIVIYCGNIAYLELDFKGALAHYTKALRLDPKNYEAYFNKGLALYNLRKLEEAIAAYDKAIELKPDDQGAYYSTGLALYKSGNYQAAIAAYDKAIELKPDYADAYHNKGLALEALGLHKEAEQAFAQAKQLQNKP